MTKSTVNEQTQDAVIEYDGELKELMEALKSFHYEDVQRAGFRACQKCERVFTKYMLPPPIKFGILYVRF